MIDPTQDYQKRRKRIRKALCYGISILLCGTFAWFVLQNGDFATIADAQNRYRLLCDAFMLPGIFLCLFGLLVFASSEGFFDIFAFSIGKAIRLMLPWLKYDKERFYEYKMRKDEQGRPRGYAFLFIVGGAFFAVGLVFLILFYSVYQG